MMDQISFTYTAGSRLLGCSRVNSISESFKSNPIPHHSHIAPLDFKTVLSMPESHKWTLSSSSVYPVSNPIIMKSVPIISLTHPNAVLLIKHSCENWGVFQVTNHGIPLTLSNHVELQTCRLFSLPAYRKLCALRSSEGITGYGLPRISIFFSKFMWSEGFSIMGSPAEHVGQLWPYEHDSQVNFCNTMEEYQKKMRDLTERILNLMFESLDLTKEDVKWYFKPKLECEEPQSLLQLNSYPACPDPARAIGLAPHTDSSLLTLLYQSNTISGLQVLKEDDDSGWVAVPPIPGALVVNVGDLMHIISNGRFKSALHRVVVNERHHRISVAYFYGPPRDVKISPPIKLIDHDHQPLFCPVTWKEYLDAKAVHFNGALEFIRQQEIAAK